MVVLDLDVPDTVQATIQARIDRLPPRERSLLEHASVVGRSFSTDLMQAILQPNLSASLEALERAQLLVSRGPDIWAFKHALIQEVVYEALLRPHRREMHRRVADALEASASDDPLMLEALAEHYASAEALDKARQYALAAGDSASLRMGVVEAGARYRTALRLWGTGDEEGRLNLLMKLGYAELLSADAAAARTVLIEAEAGWRALGHVRRAGAALALLGRAYFFMGEIDRANEALHRSVELLQPMGTSEDLVRAFVWTSVLNVVKGRADEGAPLARRGLEMAEELGMDSARSHLLVSLGVFETLSGDPSGLDRIKTALQMAEESDDAEAIGRAYVNLTKMLGELYRPRVAHEYCERGRKALHRLGAVSLEWPVAGIQAQMLVELGMMSEAKDLAREMLGPQRRQLVATAIVYAGLALGEALLREGRYLETREVLDELLPAARRVGGSMVLTPTLVLEAELEDLRGNGAAARQALAESIDVALGSSAVAHWFRPLLIAAQLMPTEDAMRIFDRVRLYADRDPSFEARLAEAEAVAGTGETGGFRRAAELYAGLELPYQEARCRLEAGDLDRASQLISKHKLDGGPLGARLAERMPT
jgi:tetratricopeptide (TPR) repeat protein